MTHEERTHHLRHQRGARYGKDPLPGFRSLGRLWRALIEDWFQVELPDDIPPHVVSLMCVGLKLSRAARPWEKPDTDDYDDAHVYLQLSQDMNPTLRLDDDDLDEDDDDLDDVADMHASRLRANMDEAMTFFAENPEIEFDFGPIEIRLACFLSRIRGETEPERPSEECRDLAGAAQPVTTKKPVAEWWRCNACGERFNAIDGFCPSCGNESFSKASVTIPEGGES